MQRRMRILLVFCVLGAALGLQAQNLARPTGGRAEMIDLTSLRITWEDNSNNETGFLIYTVVNGQLGEALGTVPENETQVTLTNLEPGSLFQFAIFAYIQNPQSFSEPTVTGLVELVYYFYKTGYGGIVGQALDARLDINGTPTTVTVSGLPAWAGYDDASRRFTGFPAAPGVYPFTVSAVFSDMTISETFNFRVLPAPSGPVQQQELRREDLDVNLYGPVREIDLGEYFYDPDTPAAAVFDFAGVGSVGIVLYAGAAPATVANFLAYVTAEGAGSYDGSFIHRSIPGFIVQGGGYRPIGGIAFESVTDRPPVVNEPGIPNLRGTLAMAKLGGNPDSATNEWFVNLDDNRGNLDYQNEGFSVFGRVAGNGMDVIDFITALPRGGYNTITVDGGSRPGLLTDVPVLAEAAPNSLNQDLLVRLSEARAVNPLAYEILSMSHPSIANVSLVGDILRIEPLALGWSELSLAMTDLDGNRIERTYALTVSVDYASWAAAVAFTEGTGEPMDDPDGDGLPNIAEFAFLRNPGAPDGGWPVPRVDEISGVPTLTLSFSTFKRTNGLQLTLQARDMGATEWETIWENAAGNTSPQVVSYQEFGDAALWLLKDTVPATEGAGRLLRVLVSGP